MRPPERCWRCNAPAVQSKGTRDYCGTHLAELLRGFDPSIWAANGVGLPCGLLRPEYGPLVEDLRCVACGAGWAGLAGDPCEWCRRSREVLIDHEHDLVLQVPEVADESSLTVWGDRLRRAVDAGIIERREAERAWRRAVRHVAA